MGQTSAIRTRLARADGGCTTFVLAALACLLWLGSCAVGTAAGVEPLPPQPAGAASCTGCHPAKAGVATDVPQLSGRSAADLTAAMRAYRAGQRPATVMDRIAKGFSDDEISALAAWFGAQR